MRLWFFLIVGLAGTGILVSLGVWQVQRLAWKQNLLGQIEGQIASDPVRLALDLPRYSPVRLIGTFRPGHIRMLASRKSVGPAYRIIRPFELENGVRILVDTGWIGDGVPVPDVPKGTLTLVGNIDWPNEADRFTPDPDPGANLWFARDIPSMAAAMGTSQTLVVLRDAPATDLGVTPWPVDTAGIPNDHLQYAVTWFSLALIWAGMTGYFLLRTRRSAR